MGTLRQTDRQTYSIQSTIKVVLLKGIKYFFEEQPQAESRWVCFVYTAPALRQSQTFFLTNAWPCGRGAITRCAYVEHAQHLQQTTHHKPDFVGFWHEHKGSLRRHVDVFKWYLCLSQHVSRVPVTCVWFPLIYTEKLRKNLGSFQYFLLTFYVNSYFCRLLDGTRINGVGWGGMFRY